MGHRTCSLALALVLLFSSAGTSFAATSSAARPLPMAAGDTPVTSAGFSSLDVETLAPAKARLAGTNRIATALAISRDVADPYRAVVIATAANFPDALAGAPFATAVDAPILLTGATVLDPAVAARLKELKAAGATKAYLLGGPGALAPAVQTAVASVFGTANTVRVGGADRYTTAALIAERQAAVQPVDGVVLASGESYPDALSAASYAAYVGHAIVLTRKALLPTASRAVLTRLGVLAASNPATVGQAGTDLMVAGGTAAVSAAVVADYPQASRVGGTDRYQTSSLIAQYAWERGVPSGSVGLATGGNFPDALAAGPWCASNGAPLLLVKPSALPAGAQLFLTEHAMSVERVQAFGGTAAVSNPVLEAASVAATMQMSKKAPVATEQTNALLSTVTSDTLVFEDDNTQIDSLQPGWVLRSNPTTEAPEGYFRKVVSVTEESDGSVTLATEPAEITDVIVKGSVDFVVPVGYSEEASTGALTAAVGAADITGKKTFKQSLKLSFGPSFEFDGPGGSKIGVKAQGALEFKQSIVFSVVVDARWEGILLVPYIKKVEQYVVYQGTVSFSAEVSASFEKDLIEVPIGPKIPIIADPIITGLLIRPEVQIVLTMSVKLQASVKLTGELVIDETKEGMRFRDGEGWSDISDGPDDTSEPSVVFEIKGAGSVKIGFGAEIGLNICGFAGPYLKLTLLEAKAEFSVNLTAKTAGIEFGIGISVSGGLKAQVPFLGIKVKKFELFKVGLTIAEWSWTRKLGTVTPPDPPLGAIVLVSVDSAEQQYSGHVERSAISDDGRYVAFASVAALVPSDTNGTMDVYVRDVTGGTTTRVSVGAAGEQGNGPSDACDISADGRFVVFGSSATNLVPNDTNDWEDVFVHDRVTGTTRRVNVASDGTQASKGALSLVSISGDGTCVGFLSFSDDLVPGDTNGVGDAFVHEIPTGLTTRMSVTSAGVQGSEESANYQYAPSFSHDGRYVAFGSFAALTPEDADLEPDVFVRDRVAGTTERASVSPGVGESTYPSISADGRWVAFHGFTSVSVDGGTYSVSRVFLHDRANGSTQLVSAAAPGNESAGSSGAAAVSGDGRFVAYASSIDNLVAGDTNAAADVFVFNRITGATVRVSAGADGAEANGWSAVCAISADGRYVSFASLASNLVGADTNGGMDIFRRTVMP